MKCRFADCRRLLFIVTTFFVVSIGHSACVQAQTDFTSAAGVLVLRNGQFLEGEISRHGDSYLVRVAEGNEIRIPAADVRLQAGSLELAYRQQRDALSPTDVDGRLRLAAWCLRAELPHRTADQLLTVRLFAPDHEGLPAMQKRLEAWQLSRSSAPSQPSSPEPATENTPNPYDTSQLDAAIEDLSTEVVESFAARIQPLLSNRCGAAGCHGFSSGQQFQLLRPTNSNTFTRRYTQRNLIAALAQIEKSLPEESPLLRKGTTLHGGEREPPLPERRAAQNELLTEWVHAVAGKKAVPAKPSNDPAVPEPEKPAVVNPLIKELLQKRAAEEALSNQSNRAESQPPTVDITDENDGNAEDSALETPSYDPAIFNRRYHGRP